MADTGLTARLLRPRVLLPALLLILIVAAVVGAPDQQSAFERSPPLRTTDAGSGGARGIYEVARRLGWPVARRTTPYPAVLDSAAVYAVLNVAQPLTPSDAHRLLDAVRRGAGLVVVLGQDDVLGDSLGLEHSDTGYASAVHSYTTCPKTDPGEPVAMWFGVDPQLYRLWPTPTNGWPADTTVFVSVRLSHRSAARLRSDDSTAMATAPAAVGFPLGAGRVAVLSDADLLRNDVIRVCRWGFGLAAVRELEWVSRDKRPVLVFDEYHQEELADAGTWTVVGTFLAHTPPGHAVLQAIGATLVLLVALGIRPVVPQAPQRIERRSALEHVEALARAYAQARATKVATRRLLRGLRRRHAHGVWRAASDERFLDAVATRHPGVAADTRTLLDAAGRSLTPAELLAVGQAVDHIDRTLDP
jgi:hypothetical protein